MAKNPNGLHELLEEYPELGTGLSPLVEEEGSELVGLVGIYALLKLRLQSVVSLLPKSVSDEDHPPGAGGHSSI